MNYVLVTHYGTAGDLMMLEPTIEALFYKHAPCRIVLRVDENHLHVLEKHPLIWNACDNLDDVKNFLPEPGKDPVIEYDFSAVIDPSRVASGVDQLAQHANVQLLRRTPSFGSYAHVDRHPRAEVVLDGMGPPDFMTELQMRDRQVVTLDGIGLSPEAKKDIMGADIYVGRLEGDGVHIAHAGGVRSIIAFDSDVTSHVPAYPNMTIVKKSYGVQALRDAISIPLRMENKKYPDCLNRGNACEWIKNKAMEFCKGRGLDVGSNQDEWALPGAIASDEKTQKFHLGPFDYIFSSHCLEHVREWEAYLKIWEESVKVGGTVFLYLPHPAMEPWRPEGDWVRGGWHVHSPEPVQLVKWLHENTKLKVQEYSVYPDSAWGFYIVAKKEV
jgi:hypothetical protein